MLQAAAANAQPTTGLDGEVAALSDIVTWSQSRCAWQRDALRRLCQSAELTPADIAELAEICKGATEKAQPISHDHVRDPDASTKKVELKSIDSVENVNALAADQRLQFSTRGMTVVYGDNGSGKSGYTRILKQVCRARDPKTATILPNIYGTQTGPLKAQVQFVAAGQNQSTEWIKDQTMERLLSSVSVFDSSTANIHVDATNDVAYVPFPMALLSNLAEACKSIKSVLQAEIDALTAQTPNTLKAPKCQPGTAVGKAIATLKATTNPQTIETLAMLSTDEEKRLEQLQSDLANDPAVIVGGLNAKLRRISVLSDKADQLSSAIAVEQQAKLKELQNEYTTHKQAAGVRAARKRNLELRHAVVGALLLQLHRQACQLHFIDFLRELRPQGVRNEVFGNTGAFRRDLSGHGFLLDQYVQCINLFLPLDLGNDIALHDTKPFFIFKLGLFSCESLSCRDGITSGEIGHALGHLRFLSFGSCFRPHRHVRQNVLHLQQSPQTPFSFNEEGANFFRQGSVIQFLFAKRDVLRDFSQRRRCGRQYAVQFLEIAQSSLFLLLCVVGNESLKPRQALFRLGIQRLLA